MEIIIAVLGGSALAALINQIGEFIRQKDKQKDDAEAETTTDILVLKEAMKYVMLDRIKTLGQQYIVRSEVDFDDRRLLNEMHNVYHSKLGGNGDLDILMDMVNELPLKTR